MMQCVAQLPQGIVVLPGLDWYADDAAWDNIDLEEANKYLGDSKFHMVFGTLGQRDQRSRKVIRSLWQRADKKFYDVNLRPPFTTVDIVEESLEVADLVKVNDEELLELGRSYDLFDEDGKIVARNLFFLLG